MKYFTSLFLLLFLYANLNIFAQLTVKDQEATPNTLLQVNDEGTFGSITLPETNSPPSSEENKLFNLNKMLIWNGTILGSGGATIINELEDAKYDGTSLFLGEEAGTNNSSSQNYNTAVGKGALNKNSLGVHNTANGYYALYSNTFGQGNTANGTQALYANTIGDYNSASGTGALYYNNEGSYNTANGYYALFSNTSGNFNNAIGYYSLYLNTTGDHCSAKGLYSLYKNTSGSFNSANGNYALYENTTGNNNTAIGYNAGPSLGYLSNTTALGNGAWPTASDQVRLGNFSVVSIGGNTSWSVVSDGRYKQNISNDVSGLDFIMGLRPITYNLNVELLTNRYEKNDHVDKDKYKINTKVSSEVAASRIKKSSKRITGFIAQEVEELINGLGFDFSGVEVPENGESLYRLRYAEFVVPIVKAMQEQQEIIENQEYKIEQLEKRIKSLEVRM